MPNLPEEPSAHPPRAYQPPPGYGYSHPFYPSQPPAYPGYAAPGYVDPAAPYGRDLATGEPLSDKSALAAGLMQLFLGWFGVGRFYIGSTTIGVLQLVSTVVSLMLCLVLIGMFLWPLIAIWVFIDAVMMFTGAVKDGQGRKLRPAGN
ncbi:NINE protein [Mycolicibacterium sphagni]|uniref:NINE protein n=1 Tax=Mycolicibacterium sphagni TaxID=1786 RepID=UPI0021F33448|nr:NINE protein [Mycolicibacterium sphagni]